MSKAEPTDDEIRELIPKIIRRTQEAIILRLLTEQELDEDKLSDPEYLRLKIVEVVKQENFDIATIVRFDDTLRESASHALSRGDEAAAIVLTATAVEHQLNGFYRAALEEKGLSTKETTKAITATNIEAKITWLLRLTTRNQLSDNLILNIRELAEIRNTIVHYKHIPSSGSKEGEFYEKFEERIQRALDNNLLSTPTILEQELKDLLETSNPYIKQARELANTLTTVNLGGEQDTSSN